MYIILYLSLWLAQDIIRELDDNVYRVRYTAQQRTNWQHVPALLYIQPIERPPTLKIIDQLIFKTKITALISKMRTQKYAQAELTMQEWRDIDYLLADCAEYYAYWDKNERTDPGKYCIRILYNNPTPNYGEALQMPIGSD